MSAHFPIYALCQGFDSNSVIAGGGGGTSKSGIPNCFQLFIFRDGHLTQDQRIPTDDCVTGLSSYSSNDTKYLAVAVGPEIRLLDSDFTLLSKFDTQMKKLIFRSVSFSPDGTFLLIVDGDDTLHLLSVPSLKKVHSQPANRSTFFKGLVASSVDEAVILSEPTEDFKLVAKVENLGLTPRALQSDGELLFYAGYGKDRKPVLICFDSQLNVVWKRKAPTDVITCLTVTSNSIAGGSVGGDVLIFDKKGRLVKCVRKVHGISVTSTAPINKFIATGGLDSGLCITEDSGKAESYWMLIGLLIVILAMVVFHFKK